MTILERKAFISSNPRIVLSSCPPPCGHFSIQESATGGLSYKVKKPLLTQRLNDIIILLYKTNPYTVPRSKSSSFWPVFWLQCHHNAFPSR
jgi:hypothetical protein